MAQRPAYAVDDPLEPRGPRRRITFWTIVAPIGAVALFVVFFIALGNSCLSDGCAKADDKVDEDKPANDLKAGAKAKIRPGDSLASIADRFGLTVDELKSCNPAVDPQTIQPGQFLVVSAVTCEGSDLAAAGANPDPLAGETSAAAPKPKPNATAAADPSLRGEAAAGTTTPPADGAAAGAGAGAGDANAGDAAAAEGQ